MNEVPAGKPTEGKTAEQRGMDLLMMPMRDLPLLALEFARRLCAEVGMCGETFLTAYTVYAQCVERLPCSDNLYKARPTDEEWFANWLEDKDEQPRE